MYVHCTISDEFFDNNKHSSLTQMKSTVAFVLSLVLSGNCYTLQNDKNKTKDSLGLNTRNGFRSDDVVKDIYFHVCNKKWIHACVFIFILLFLLKKLK